MAKGSKDSLEPTRTPQIKIRVRTARSKLETEEPLVGKQLTVCPNSVLAKEWARERRKMVGCSALPVPRRQLVGCCR